MFGRYSLLTGEGAAIMRILGQIVGSAQRYDQAYRAGDHFSLIASGAILSIWIYLLL
jgi:hypothetical protein